jgi:hypothetical protein
MYILMIILSSGYAAVVMTPEFSSLERCEAAKAHIINEQTRTNFQSLRSVACLPK